MPPAFAIAIAIFDSVTVSIAEVINGILSWDMATYMPKNSRSQRVKQIKKIYDYSSYKELKKLLEWKTKT